MMERLAGFKQTEFLFGSYVIRAVPNSFNKKIGWWISKSGYMVSYYCFSTAPGDNREIEWHMKFKDAYIKMFDTMITNIDRNRAEEE